MHPAATPRGTSAGAITTGPRARTSVKEGWPKPLPDTRHSHDGWTWGSFGGVYAESPDRIWIAMRGELPLPEGAAPWTPYAALNPSRGNATGNGDGISATCQPEDPRGWERRLEHSIIVVDGEGNLVDEWEHLDPMFSQLPCGRGPHQIKISPYDPEKHVWIIDDQLHMIYRFTYDGKLEISKGELGVRGRGPNTFDRPTDIAWLPDGTYFITDGYGGTRVAKFGPDDDIHQGLGSGAEGSAEPRAERVQHGAQHRDQRRPAPLRRRPRPSAHAGVRHGRQLPRHVADALAALAARAPRPSSSITSSTRTASSGPATAERSAS